jgi:D-glycerate 3-kinase
MGRHSHSPIGTGFTPALVERVLDDALDDANYATGDGQPRVYGITGLQGCGKSTLAGQLSQEGAMRAVEVVVLSIDDFYLTRRERQSLAKRVHPLLATRGPPGTHDLTLACDTLDALKAFTEGDCLALPRFDKLADTRLPRAQWPRVRRKPDLVIFEGWFLKVPPEPEALLALPLNALERDEDSDGRWRRDCNAALAAYEPLWQRIDRLLWLRGPGFDSVLEWRWQQEQTLQAASPGRNSMTRAQVERFVLYFERVSKQAQRSLADIADVIIDIDEKRQEIVRRR